MNDMIEHHHDDGRDESANQRMDRNWNELLQEVRVTQTPVQILGGFMLTLAFQPRFADLNAFQRDLYIGLMTLAATTIVAGLAPIYLHRAYFRKQRKLTIVAFGHVVLTLQLIAVAAIVIGTVLLVLDLAVGRGAAIGIASGLAVAVSLLAASPLILGGHGREHGSAPAATARSSRSPLITRIASSRGRRADETSSA
jgi:hypothetical protein